MQSSARKNPVDARNIARPRIALALAGAWFALGCAALLLVPASRGSDPWLGWLPFWLVGVPAIEWALLRLSGLELGSATRAVRSRARRVVVTRGPSSRRIRKLPGRSGRVGAATLMTALFVRQI